MAIMGRKTAATKADLVEAYERAMEERTLLYWLADDLLAGAQPDAVEVVESDQVELRLYRSGSAFGGYVVQLWDPFPGDDSRRPSFDVFPADDLPTKRERTSLDDCKTAFDKLWTARREAMRAAYGLT
jgi:hypothetical protein